MEGAIQAQQDLASACDSALEAIDRDAADKLVRDFHTAVARLRFRTQQNFSYWQELPWALILLMRPFLDRFDDDSQASECLQLSWSAAILLIKKYDECSNKAALGVVSYRLLNAEGPFLQHLLDWAHGRHQHMHPTLFDELMSYSTCLVCMQRLEGRRAILKRSCRSNIFRTHRRCQQQ